ncbi:hypothetical protein GCM10027344_27830 [Spelaeicoccus albus]
MFAVRVEDVVIVEVRDIANGDFGQSARSEVQSPQPSGSVQDQRLTVEGPIWSLKKQISGIEYVLSRAVCSDGRDDCPLAARQAASSR